MFKDAQLFRRRKSFVKDPSELGTEDWVPVQLSKRHGVRFPAPLGVPKFEKPSSGQLHHFDG